MNKIIGLALLIVGAVLLYFGYNAYNSAASEVSEFVTGSPTDNAVWYLVAGGLAAVIGIGVLLKK
ncbi:DUF3185 family protein [Arsukibacterium sp.]|uniref:DUF3185 family protein n=1 Tax=Arsukibacterium sp. TaxID=1977258 RepID=UPI001BD237A8|nr:DUF3185 family protein [Arsukibacterium sp.]